MTCVEKLRHSGAVYRFQGIIECYDKGCVSDAELVEFDKLKSDDTIIAGRTLSSYACAILDKLGIEKYTRDNEDVLFLIDNM